MKRKVLLFSFLIFMSFTLFNNLVATESDNILSNFKKINSVNSKNVINFNSDINSNELIARRSGGRTGSRSFGSRRSSTTRSTSTGFSTRRRTTPTRYRSSSRRYPRRSTVYYSSGRRSSGGSLIGIFIFLAIIGIIVFFVIKSRKREAAGYVESTTNETFTPIKIQFGLHATADNFKTQVLDLASSLSYDTDEDMKELVSETSMLLINNQDYIKYAYVEQGTSTRNLTQAETDYDNLINEERKKLSQETFQNKNGSITQRELSEDNKPSFMEIKEYFIITLIVSYSSRKIELQDSYDWQYYEGILSQLAAIPGSNIVAAEIIWSPDAAGDVLTEDDITMYYPKMVQL